MTQVQLINWDNNYATSITEVMPVNDTAVFFKTKSGNIVKGWYNSSNGFDSCQDNWDILDDAVEWHPVKVDM